MQVFVYNLIFNFYVLYRILGNKNLKHTIIIQYKLQMISLLYMFL